MISPSNSRTPWKPCGVLTTRNSRFAIAPAAAAAISAVREPIRSISEPTIVAVSAAGMLSSDSSSAYWAVVIPMCCWKSCCSGITFVSDAAASTPYR